MLTLFAARRCHLYNNKKMPKQKATWSHSLVLSDPIQTPQQSPSGNNSLELHAFNDRVLRRDHPCVVQRELSNYRRKVVIIRPARQPSETSDEASLRAQIRLTRQQQDPPLFSSLPKQPPRQKQQQSVIRIHPQQSKPKPPKQRIRPIISEAHLQPQFLSVGKMPLVNDRGKQSQSVLIQADRDEKPSKEEKALVKAERYLPCSQLIREINVIKEKFNIQRILNTHAHQEENPSNFHRFISIRAYQGRKNKKEKLLRQPTQDSEDSKLIVVDSVQISSTPATPQQNLASIVTLSSNKIKKPTTPSLTPKRPRKPKAFKAPFQGYYYRDLLWKVNFTNSQLVEAPVEYDQRLRVHVGRGNNSCMVAGLIARRNWLAFTDSPDNANFVWTQLKVISFFRKQAEMTQAVPQAIDPSKSYQPGSLLTLDDSQKYFSYMQRHQGVEQRSDARLLARNRFFQYNKVIKSSQIKEQHMQNHLPNSYVIGNKKALFHTMSHYFQKRGEDPFLYLPLTFHLKNGLEDQQYYDFLKYYQKRARQIAKGENSNGYSGKQYNAWIVKPGQNSNRGNGIKVCLTLEEIRAAVKTKQSYGDGTYRTYIVQAYIERPLLYCNRKFDLRHYILITCINGRLKGYWYKQGYVRTTSSEYSLVGAEGKVHLTNDAVQKQLPEYGKYQKGNKLSYEDLSAYIDRTLPQHRGAFFNKIYPRMKQLATHAIRASSGSIDPRKLGSNFQLFGLDFMIDAELGVWLIEVNSNPCLELSCPLLASLIPKVVENTLQITLDALFPPPSKALPRGQLYSRELEKENKFELVYDERVEGLLSGPQGLLDTRLQEQEDDVFEDCGGDDWEDF